VGPLDERDGVLGDLQGQADLLVIGLREAVGVEVRDAHPAGVPLGHGERRAGHVLGHTEGTGGPSHQRGLPRADLPDERHDVAGRDEASDRRADRLGLGGGACLDGDQNRPSCSGSPDGAPRGTAAASSGSAGPGSSGSDGSIGAGSSTPSKTGILAKSASSVASIDGV